MKTKNLQVIRLRYRKLLESGMAISLLFCIILFQGSKRFETGRNAHRERLSPIAAIDVPKTVQEKKITPVERPWIPLPGEDEEVIDIDPTNLIEKWNEIASEPPMIPEVDPIGDPWIFYVVEKEPRPVGGYAAIASHLKYPKLAQLAGIEGRVIIRTRIDENGNVVDMLVQKSLGFEACDQNAMTAIRSVKWEPAFQRDRPVSVWISVYVDFKLQ